MTMAWKHISGVVEVSEYGGGRPDNELPSGGGGEHPDNELPSGGAHPWLPAWIPRLIRWLLGPHIGGGPAGKPPGIPILPLDPDWDIPVDPPHPWLPGHFVIVDGGWGKPPAWGRWFTDPGYGIPEGGKPDNTLPARPGHWVPGDPSYGVPERERRCSGEKPKPKWIWIEHIGPDWGKPAEPKAVAAKK
jgi:hypothetical protein